MIACEYDTDRNAGAILTALELYNLPPPQENGAALRQWRDRVRYAMNVMNQIGPQDQPEPRLLAKWLYDRLKRHPLMRRHVDKVRDAPADSEARTFAWLWGRLETCLQESQQEANALSIQEALRRGPGKVKKEDANAMLAKPGKGAKGDQDGKGKGKLGKDGKGSPKGGGKPKGGDQPKGKHQDDKNKTTSKPSELTAAQKAEMPCIYFSQGKCYREKCPFKHASSNPTAAPAKADSKPKITPPKPGLVALLAASVAAAAATYSVPPPSTSQFLDFVGDTGAGEWLGSRRALECQGVDASQLEEWIGTSSTSSYPLCFSTGGLSTCHLHCWCLVFRVPPGAQPVFVG